MYHFIRVPGLNCCLDELKSSNYCFGYIYVFEISTYFETNKHTFEILLACDVFSLKEMKREDKKKNFVLPTWKHGIEVQKMCTYTWRYTTSGTKVKHFHTQCACKVGGTKVNFFTLFVQSLQTTLNVAHFYQRNVAVEGCML